MSRLDLSSPSVVRALFPLACAPLLSAQGLVDTARRYLGPPQGSFHHLADLDGDGDDDAVWFQDDPGPDSDVLGFRAYFNDGAGELGQPGPLVSFPDTSYFPLDGSGVRRLADVTGDGIPDMLAGSSIFVPQTSSYISTLHLYPALLPGVFGPPIDTTLGGWLRGSALGNVDADAAREIALVEFVAVSAFGRKEVVAWYDWNGAGLTRSPESLGAGSLSNGPTMLAALDLEGDGDSDLVYGRANSQALRMSLTAAGAPGPITFLELPLAQPAWLGPYTCDLEGGGPEDLLVACGHGNASFALLSVLNETGLLVPGEEQAFVAHSGEVYGSSFRVGDWDGDGDGDVLYYGWQEPGGTTEGIAAFFENDGANGFGAGPVALAETNDPPAGETFPGSPVDPSDLDGDGRLDFVLPRSVQFGRGRFESALVPITDTFFGPTPIALSDQEGDGDLDLFFDDSFLGSHMALNDGTGAFEEMQFPPPPPPQRERIGTVALGDFDGDGRTDFLAGIFIPPPGPFDPHVFEEIRLYADDGLGGFRDAGRASAENMLSSDRRTNLAQDLDGDADVDVLGRFAGGGGYWPNRGHGRFAEFQPLFPGCCTVPSALGDLDGDDDLDVVTVSVPFSPSIVSAWKNRAPPRRARHVERRTPAFDPSPVFETSQGAPDPESFSLADHDMDGDLDLAFSHGRDIRLFENDGNAAFAAGAILSTDLPPVTDPPIAFLAFEDLDADGDVDLLAGAKYLSEFPRNVLVFRSLGDGSFEAARPYAGGIMGSAGDLDGDGDLDLSGRALVRSLRFDGPAAGRIRQYGAGTPGSGGAVPVLGATGPLRIGATDAEIRLRRGRGGAPFALFYSLSAGSGPTVPFPGAPTLLGPPIQSDVYAALGAPGLAGAGRFDLDLGPELASLVGLTLYFQASLVDPEAADGFALTNGLELTFGY